MIRKQIKKPPWLYFVHKTKSSIMELGQNITREEQENLIQATEIGKFKIIYETIESFFA